MREGLRKFIIFVACFVSLYGNRCFAQENIDASLQKVFSLGRSAGSSYFYLINLSDKTTKSPYAAIKKDYSSAFMSLSLMEGILKDISIDKTSQKNLAALEMKLDKSLNSGDLNQISVQDIKDEFISDYDIIAQNISSKYSSKGAWLLVLGFYTSFQQRSLEFYSPEKILLSGFNQVLDANPYNSLPVSVNTSLKSIANFDKVNISTQDLAFLAKNIGVINDYFSGKSPESQVKILGGWSGVMVDPDNVSRKTVLSSADGHNFTLDVEGVAKNIVISDVQNINNYYTFMFKPFGTQKMYVKFDAVLSDNTLTGQAIDCIGQKGNLLLSKKQ